MKTEILQKIQMLHHGVIKYSGGVLSKSAHSLELSFVTNVAPDVGLEQAICAVVKNFVPNSITQITAVVKKVVTLPEFVQKSALSWFRANHAITAQAVTENSIIAQIKPNIVTVKISVEHMQCQMLIGLNVQTELKEYLQTQFVDNFEIEFFDTGETAFDESLLKAPEAEVDQRPNVIRTLKVDDVTRLFDNDSTREASYISDTKDFYGEVYLAGVITDIKRKETKPRADDEKQKDPKAYFIIEFNDRTGTTSGVIFPNKQTLPKVEKLAVGSEIIVLGEFESRNGYHNLRIKTINYCAFPKNFVPVARPKRKAPDNYCIVKPKPLVVETQDSFLVETDAPECFKGRTFVVFDLETTGTDTDDKITEIGAVKIVDGKIESYFETLVNPQRKITAEIEALTGINDVMVKDAPTYEKVCGDFYKYCQDATLVAHNIDFDSRFVRRQSQPLDYYFDHPLMDTLAIGREVVTGVSNYKLNTLCDKFGISFNHHRAYSDALATAKLFIELIRIRKTLPF